MIRAAKPLRLATRSSLLAMAQSRQVADALMADEARLDICLQPVSTPGDRDQQTPLQQVRDGDFFSAEIDAALLAGQADFAVHSRKDLGERPAGLVAAATPARANPRDAILFRADILDRLRTGARIRVGSSSARRATNLRRFLPAALPRLGPPPALEFRPLRGPVEQRISHLHAPDKDPGHLHAVVIALAGLERLWRDAAGQRALRPLLRGLRWLVPPLSECPAAAGQGALLVECRATDTSLKARLARLHDERTATEVSAEFAALREPSTHLDATLGATAITVPELGRVLFARRGPGAEYPALQWDKPAAPARARAWDGAEWTRACQRRRLPVDIELISQPALFVAHWHALTINTPTLNDRRLWTSGVTSWRQLASRGIWVEGCADGLGFDALRSTLASPVLQLPALSDWAVLTRSGAEASWANSGIDRLVASYALETPVASALTQIRDSAREATHFFWGSREQYLALRDCLPRTAEHACGNGKTLQALRDLGEKPRVFPNRKAWLAWVG